MRRIVGSTASLIFLTFFLFAFSGPGNGRAEAGARAVVKALQLVQKHYFFGIIELTLSKEGARAECKGRMNFVVVTKAPSWTVTVYRLDDKSYFSESIEQFVDTSIVSGIMFTYRGHDIMQGSRPQIIEVFGHKATKKVDKVAEFVFLPPDGSLPPQIDSFIYGTYKMPTCGGIPLRYVRAGRGRDLVTQMDETGHNQLQISTDSIKDVHVPLTYFEPPSGLKRVKSIRDVILSSSKRSESADFQIMFDKLEPKKTDSSAHH